MNDYSYVFELMVCKARLRDELSLSNTNVFYASFIKPCFALTQKKGEK